MDDILVGVDGSEAAAQALRWAVAEARCHHAGLTVVLVAEPAYLYGGELPYGTTGADLQEEAATELEAIVDGVMADLAGDQPPDGEAPLQRRVETGDPRRVLRDLSAEVDLLVVGARGHSEVAGLLLGSVGQYLATHADCPVTIVRRRHKDTDS